MSTFAWLRFAARIVPALGGLAATAVLCAGAAAQTNVQWVKFKNAPNKITVSPTALSDGGTEVDMETGDLDNDGWLDVVVFRKEQSSTTGKRAQVLLMNNHGRLEDKTLLYATASDVGGDLGFRTATNTRDGKIVDVDGDGWLDVVTCPTLSDGEPKHISHPRVYMNLGDDGSGNWLGLRFENGRIPQLLTSLGLAVAPRFCEVTAGDVTGSNGPDLYFIDYDSTETGINEAANADLDDRLLVNDGNGFFTDSGTTHFSGGQLQSAFGVKAKFIDLNGDDQLDIVKNSTLGSPQSQRAMYNSPLGSFQPLSFQDFGSGSPYGFDMGNLNNDGLPDLAGADDGADVYRLATGLDPLGKLTFGPLKNYSFVTGGDDGFSHNVHIQDLNGDGWNDVTISSVDVDFTGCSGRMHIYHNLGGTVGGDITLREESEFDNGGGGAGWKSVVGMTATDLAGSYDMAYGDFDHDTDIDVLMGVCSGTRYWQNQTAPPLCQTDLGFAGPGNCEFSICGEDLTQTASTATMLLAGAAPNKPVFLAVGLVNDPTPIKGGMLVPVPVLSLITSFSTNGLGELTVPVPGNSGTPLTVYMQCIVKNGPTFEFSNALEVVLGL